ncbi:PhzF family phenazine biosynthesis protein [Spectribacter hydrogenoxidans]|uniref:PhzF family phenazine biosynthesis protein n=1 Tax=Spectribacter hydrogenoxidans TaxID=3075608 RepID=A0ABU3BZA5_9GAMM|nr:PhzF family phenazine biosynthesis protein [Salinisphaera sp. W335]MDT0634595.1 PhzF family phenazine biosynthesis protein [Salinisphaera sp. W335]
MTVTTQLPLYQVDAFTDRPFAGNPAAVVLLEQWPADTLLQAIAAENNLAETAYLVPAGSRWELRWFTPTTEVVLCGHATLASAFVLWHCRREAGDEIEFDTRHSGRLRVTREADWLQLDLPAHDIAPSEPPAALVDAMGVVPAEVRAGPNWLLRYPDAATIRSLEPDPRALSRLPDRGVIVTAPGDEAGVDFVSRYFAPNFGVDEDPVTGSAHCMLAPFWAARLGRDSLAARQLSRRGGFLRCEIAGDRVLVAGQAVLYMTGAITVPEDRP